MIACARNLAVAAAVITLAGCATRPPASDPAAVASFEQINDRYEPLNRAMFDVDQTLDKALIRPVAWTYNKVVPEPGREGLSNVLANLRSPITFINDLLQGEGRRAGITLWRLVINSTIGIGGLFDVGNAAGVRGHTEDFGQTLAVWGVGDGSYLYLPILGPSSIRDGVGLGVDNFAFDPVSWYSYNPHNIQWIQWAYLGATLVDAKGQHHEHHRRVEKVVHRLLRGPALGLSPVPRQGNPQRRGPPAGSMPGFDDDGADPFAEEKPQTKR